MNTYLGSDGDRDEQQQTTRGDVGAYLGKLTHAQEGREQVRHV
jgi:hypothetical protein